MLYSLSLSLSLSLFLSLSLSLSLSLFQNSPGLRTYRTEYLRETLIDGISSRGRASGLDLYMRMLNNAVVTKDDITLRLKSCSERLGGDGITETEKVLKEVKGMGGERKEGGGVGGVGEVREVRGEEHVVVAAGSTAEEMVRVAEKWCSGADDDEGDEADRGASPSPPSPPSPSPSPPRPPLGNEKTLGMIARQYLIEGDIRSARKFWWSRGVRTREIGGSEWMQWMDVRTSVPYDMSRLVSVKKMEERDDLKWKRSDVNYAAESMISMEKMRWRWKELDHERTRMLQCMVDVEERRAMYGMLVKRGVASESQRRVMEEEMGDEGRHR